MTSVTTLNIKYDVLGWGVVILMLELWQNDIFLILMGNNFTMYRIMQLNIEKYLEVAKMSIIMCSQDYDVTEIETDI